MCLGLNMNEKSFNYDEVDVHLKTKNNRKKIIPSKNDLCEEVIRRHCVAFQNMRKCKSDKAHQLKTWLVYFPVANQNDVIFMKKEEEMFNKLTTDALAGSNAMKELLSENAVDRCFGIVPYLRLYCAVIENKVLQEHVNMHLWESREGTDRRNSSTRRNFFCYLAANKHNNPSFKPEISLNLQNYSPAEMLHYRWLRLIKQKTIWT